ncbi:tetratricopeptide repeat protein [Actinomycetospora sp. CA-084318]|uniref:tetratricopeptide repeat protein n=1 Tax=Actinomycetospora sp. CA-084318 TaxID=3239892 RepID=UPI003D988957
MALFGARRAADVEALGALLEEAERSRTGGKARAARRTYHRVLRDAEALRTQAPERVDGLRCSASVGLGDLAMVEGRAVEALEAYRSAASAATPPARVRQVLAEDAVARNDWSPAGVRALVAHLADTPIEARSPAVVQRLWEMSWPPAESGAEALDFADQLTDQVVAVDPPTPWAWLSRGHVLGALGRHDDAVLALMEAERLAPGHPGAPYELGVLHEAAQDAGSARVAYGRAVVLDPDRPEVLLAVGRTTLTVAAEDTHDSARLRAEAASALRRACRNAPSLVEAWVLLGRALREDDPEGAIAALTSASQLEPQRHEHLLDLADVATDRGDTGMAVATLESASVLRPDDADIHDRAGALLAELGSFAGAVEHLTKAVSLEPGRDATRLRLARALHALGTDADAIRVLRAVDGRSTEARHVLGVLEAALGRFDEAVDELTAALEQQRTGVVAHALGCVHMRREDWASAVAAFDTAEALGGAPADLDFSAGVARHRAGDLSGARERMDRARAEAPDEPSVLYAHAAIALDEGDLTAAGTGFGAVVALVPDHPGALLGLGHLMELRGDVSAAVTHYQRVVAAAPGHHLATSRLAATAMRGGRLDEARAALDRIPGDDGDLQLARLRALCSLRSGDAAGAATAFAAVLAESRGRDVEAAHDARLATERAAWDAMRRHEHEEALRLWEAAQEFATDGAPYASAITECLLRSADGLGPESDAPTRARLRASLERASVLAGDDDRISRRAAVLALLDDRPLDAAALLRPLGTEADPTTRFHLALARAAAAGSGAPVPAVPVDEDEAAALRARIERLRGLVLAWQRQFSDALDAFVRSVAHEVDPSVFPAIARCALECHRSAPAIAVLDAHAAASIEAAVGLGALHARAGELDEALRLLTGPSEAEPDRWRPTMLALHLEQLSRATRRGDLADAVIAGRRALEHADDSGLEARLTTVVTELEALAGTEETTTPTAMVAWDARLRQRPTDLAVIHHTAVLAERTLLRGDVPAGEEQRLLSLLVESWASVLHSPAYWVRLKERSGRVVGVDERAELRRRLGTGLVRLLRDAGIAHGPASPAETTWGVEMRTAGAVASLVPARHVQAWPAGYTAGPLLLERVAESGRDGASMGAELARLADRMDVEAAVTVRDLLSPSRVIRHLLDAGLLDEAVEEVARRDDGTPDAPRRGLVQEVHLRLALRHVDESSLSRAAAPFLAAGRAGAELAPHAATVREAVSARASELVRESDDNHREAVELMTAARALLPQDDGFDADLGARQTQLGRWLNNQRDYEAAVPVLREAHRLAPQDETARHFAQVGLANLARELVDRDAAADRRRGIEILTESVSMAPRGSARSEARSDAADMLVDAGLSFFDKNAFDRAAELFRSALTFEDTPTVWKALGASHSKRQRYEEAAEVLGNGVSKHPGDLGLRENWGIALHNAGIAHVDAGRYEGGVSFLQHALRAHPNDSTRQSLSRAHVLRAESRLSTGGLAAARADLLEAVRLDPTDPQLRALVQRLI